MKKEKKEEQSKNLVVKDNRLNAITYFKSATQLKIFAKLLVEIRNNPKEVVYSLSIKEILEEISLDGARSENYTYLKRVARKMFHVVDLSSEEEGDFDLNSLFSRIRTRKSFIDFKINPDLKKYVVGVKKNFMAYWREYGYKLASGFSMRIYELLKQYQNHRTLTGFVNISIKDYRKFIKVGKNQYKQYGHLKAKTILVAQKELGDKTDTIFTFEEVKDGRKVVRLIFHIFPNTKILKEKSLKEVNPRLTIEQQEKKKEYLEVMLLFKEKPFFITENEDFENLLNLATKQNLIQEDLENIVFAAKEYIEKTKDVIVMAVLIRAIKEKWKPTVRVKKRKQEDKNYKISSLKSKIYYLEEDKEKIEQKFESHLFDEAKKILKDLSKEEQEKIIKPYKDELDKKVEGSGTMTETLIGMNFSFAEERAIKEIKKEHFEKDRDKLLNEFLQNKNLSFDEIDKEIKSLEKELKTLKKEQA